MKTFFSFFTMLLLVGNVLAQAPEKMSYQAVIRDQTDKLWANHQVGIRISVLQYSATGTAVYVENHSTSTNANGLVSLEIGSGTVSKGVFSDINWQNGPYFIKTETDLYGGASYSISSVSQLLSVPFALHAKTAGSFSGDLAEKDPVFTQSQAAAITANDIAKLGNLSGVNTGDQDLSSLATKKALADSAAKVRAEMPNVSRFITSESDPVFSAWNKSTGITIKENQITDLAHFSNADEIDPKYQSDSSFIKSGVRTWNSSLAKTINAADTTRWSRAETDPVFAAWDRTSGIFIRENQITDLDHFTNSDEIDPVYSGDSSFIKTGVRTWNSSLAKTINAADTTRWGRAETDPVFAAWDRTSGIFIRENQITDLDHFTNSDEIDPAYSADSSFIKTGVRTWNSSLAKTINAEDTTRWGQAETDPVFAAWDRTSGIFIRENQITDLDHFTNSDEIDPVYSGDSSFIKSGVRTWNNSLAKTINAADTTRWGQAETDPVFAAWDRTSGIFIRENQITDLDHFTNSDEIDPVYSADSSFIKTGIRSWNSSLARNIGVADTTRWGQAETDPVFAAWDRSTGILIRENQITDLNHFTNDNEIDPVYSADSSYLKSGIRSWDGSLAKDINAADTARWNNKSDFNGNFANLTNAPNLASNVQDKSIAINSGGTLSVTQANGNIVTVKQSTGLVGIGTNATDPHAQLEIGGTEGLLVRGTANSGTVRALGAGVRMHWYPRKGAFRVGNAETDWWDDDGTANPKLALYSIGMGYHPRASGVASTAIGAYNQATGDYSLALGSYSQATSSHSIAIGTQAYASGIYSIAMGSGANTNGKDGSMVFGDDAYFQTAYSTADNQLTMRFIGGYRLWSSYPDSVSGVYMRHGQSGWSNYCDRNRKENFKQLDYEEMLVKIKAMPVTEWNYIGIDSLKYIGPMAQDFYKAFKLNGVDSLGINSICIDGVNMAAIKGLIERTDELKSALEELRLQKEKVAQFEALLNQQNAIINEMKKDIADLKNSRAK
jgi:hypothetical protein